MQDRSGRAAATRPGPVSALGEEPIFGPGDPVRIASRSPVGHYRMPFYLRGKRGTIEAVVEPAAIDNEEEGWPQRRNETSLLPHCHSDDRDLARLCRVAAGWFADRSLRGLA
jgi:hypothetical protein